MEIIAQLLINYQGVRFLNYEYFNNFYFNYYL